MRTNFVKTLLELARADRNIMLLTGDLGFMALEPFRDELPDQYLNVGVSEQNMTGVAAGLALSGKQVFIYSIIPFVTMRNLEHIRNDIAAHNLNVKIVGVGAGYSYSIQGSTHQAKEDIGVLRSIPNLKIIAPGDPWEVREAVKALARTPGPAYLRLGRNGEPQLHNTERPFELGKGIMLKDSNHVTLIATSNMLESALNVASELENQGLGIRLISMHTIKPLDVDLILDCAKNTKAIFTLEEHYVNGGLGTAVAEVLAESAYHPIFFRFGLPDQFDKLAGSQKYLREKNGISESQIKNKILELLSK